MLGESCSISDSTFLSILVPVYVPTKKALLKVSTQQVCNFKLRIEYAHNKTRFALEFKGSWVCGAFNDKHSENQPVFWILTATIQIKSTVLNCSSSV